MVRVLKRTMVLDISGLPATLGRFQIAKAVDYLYCEDFVVKSVQFTPGKRLHVVFDGPEAKNAAEQFMPATIHGVTCRVVESGPHVQLINVYHYPYEEDNASLLAVLGGYGEVRDIRYQRYSSSATLSTGNRLARMVRKNDIPRSPNVAGYAIKTWYAGQPTECDICREAHVARTARLEANAVNTCRRAMWPVTEPTLPMSGALPQPMLLLMFLLMCRVMMLLLLRRFRPPLQPQLVAGDLKSICKIVDVVLPLKVLEIVLSSLRHSCFLALVTLLGVKQ